MAESYRRAGVDLKRMEAIKDRISKLIKTTWGPQVASDNGAFSGTIRWPSTISGRKALVAATTDGVGTKTLLAGSFGRWQVIGVDVVNHCLNDLLCSAAEPLFFMDYIGTSHLDEEAVLGIVEGMVAACAEAKCPILGGETALMPNVYLREAVEVVGTMVGTLRAENNIGPGRVRPRDVLVALPSRGLHTNGYSLVRHLFSKDELEQYYPELGTTLADALLVAHRSYLAEMRTAVGEGLHAAAHVTGGGLPGNLPRALPKDLTAVIDTRSWQVPPLFGLIQRKGGLTIHEMFEVFNMGVGMVLVMEAPAAVDLLAKVPDAWIIGEVAPAKDGAPRLKFER